MTIQPNSPEGKERQEIEPIFKAIGFIMQLLPNHKLNPQEVLQILLSEKNQKIKVTNDITDLVMSLCALKRDGNLDLDIVNILIPIDQSKTYSKTDIKALSKHNEDTIRVAIEFYVENLYTNNHNTSMQNQFKYILTQIKDMLRRAKEQIESQDSSFDTTEFDALISQIECDLKSISTKNVQKSKQYILFEKVYTSFETPQNKAEKERLVKALFYSLVFTLFPQLHIYLQEIKIATDSCEFQENQIRLDPWLTDIKNSITFDDHWFIYIFVAYSILYHVIR